MSGPPVLSVSHLSKTYCKDLRRSLRYGLADMVREVVGPAVAADHRPLGERSLPPRLGDDVLGHRRDDEPRHHGVATDP